MKDAIAEQENIDRMNASPEARDAVSKELGLYGNKFTLGDDSQSIANRGLTLDAKQYPGFLDSNILAASFPGAFEPNIGNVTALDAAKAEAKREKDEAENVANMMKEMQAQETLAENKLASDALMKDAEIEASEATAEIAPYDFDMNAQYTANAAYTTASTIDRINAQIAAEREAQAAAQAEAESAAAAEAEARQDRYEKDLKAQEALNSALAEKNIAVQAALESAPSISFTSTMPTGTDLAGTSSSLLGTGVSTPNGPDISGPQGGGGYSGAPSEGSDVGRSAPGSAHEGARSYGGEGDGGYSGGNFGDSRSDNSDSVGRGDSGDARGGYLQNGRFDQRMAQGGIAALQYNLGSYSDGGRLLKGPGDGVSDSIPATIGRGQPARLADGEFVIPARIVSELGNGSTDAGARKLYAMMDRIQKVRRKTKNVAANTKAAKHLPA
jgi:hypothetical protein